LTEKETTMRRVVVEFVGGCMDGKTVCTYSEDPVEAQEAEGYLWVSGDGAVGRRFMCASPAAMEALKQGSAKHGSELGLTFRKYEIFERMENGDEILVRAKNVLD
jgi:hypothetical protein